MLNNEFLKDLSSRISSLLPQADRARQDVENAVHDILQSAFSRLNLVTREEFDAQIKVLERAEQTITELEAKIASLEAGKQANPPPDTDTP
jgi:BMFP domain-containing protein YqiC